jgi:hypothetical protein
MSGKNAAKVINVSYTAVINYDFYIRSAKEYGFDFEVHHWESFEILRNFVKQRRDYKRHEPASRISKKEVDSL